MNVLTLGFQTMHTGRSSRGYHRLLKMSRKKAARKQFQIFSYHRREWEEYWNCQYPFHKQNGLTLSLDFSTSRLHYIHARDFDGQSDMNHYPCLRERKGNERQIILKMKRRHNAMIAETIFFSNQMCPYLHRNSNISMIRVQNTLLPLERRVDCS